MLLGGAGSLGWMRFVEPWWFKKTSRRVPIGLGGEVKLLHLSDFHADPMPLDYLQSAIRAGLAWKPDLICCTGDFITRLYDRWDDYTRILGEMSQAAPTFACLGNHDGGAWARKAKGYPTAELLRESLAAARIRLLHNERERVEFAGGQFMLAGVGDWWAGETRPEGVLSERRELPTVLLSHNPDSKEDLRPYAWDLMLSGHTHGGQLSLPGIGEPLAPIRDKRYVRDLHRLGDRWLHITAGVGCLHTARFNCRPEISLLTLA